MIIRRKHWALQTGYDIKTDLPYGFTLCFGERNTAKQGEYRYRLVIVAHWDWPRFEWSSDTWMLNEPNTVRGLPIRRQGVRSSTWTGREYALARIAWPRCFFWCHA
jgi:hypothetical protein